MKVLNYSQILTALSKDKIKISGVEFLLPADVKSYVSERLPAAGSFIVGTDAILVAMSSVERGGQIVMFLPSGPPDPGMEGGNRNQ